MAVKVTIRDQGIASKLGRIANDRGLGIFAAESMVRGMTPFVPMQAGALFSLVVTKPFVASYLAIYANYQYNGEGFNYSKEMHPLATHHWDQAWIAKKAKQFERELQGYVDRMG